jgi:hypothetical protein
LSGRGGERKDGRFGAVIGASRSKGNATKLAGCDRAIAAKAD